MYGSSTVNIINGSDPKFSIGIYGEWGSGKTTLMRMIERKLTPERFRWEDIPTKKPQSDMLRQYLKTNFKIEWIDSQTFDKSSDGDCIHLKKEKHLSIVLNKQHMNATLRIDERPVYQFLVRRNGSSLFVCESNILTVWFNAWRYENEKEFALIPLMKTIAYTIGEHPIYKDIKPLILRALAIIGKDALRFYAMKYFMTQKGIDEFEANLRSKFEDSEEFDKEALYFEGIKKIEQKMLEILENKRHHNSRIVVFIDDLDRCSPEKTLEVFESIKVFLDIKGFIFILGLSRETLDKLIVAKYEKMGLKDISGEQYIRKIIQIEIQIGKWIHNSIGDLIDRISGDIDDNYREVVKENKGLIEQVVESNPRQAKRFINNLIIALAANPHLDYNTFLVIEALQKRWKYFYKNLSNAKFLKEIKRGLQMSRDQRIEYISTLEHQKAQGLPYDLLPIFDDLKYCYVDEELWSFLRKFGDPILHDISASGEQATEEEVTATQRLEDYQQASESSNIPIPRIAQDGVTYDDWTNIARLAKRYGEDVGALLSEKNEEHLIKFWQDEKGPMSSFKEIVSFSQEYMSKVTSGSLILKMRALSDRLGEFAQTMKDWDSSNPETCFSRLRNIRYALLELEKTASEELSSLQ
jgi:hypothetical protein